MNYSMTALGQTSALTPAERSTVDRGTAALPACYTEGLDACLNPEGWTGRDPQLGGPQHPLAPADCALINAAYDVSAASFSAMEAKVDALPNSTEICGTAQKDWVVLASVGGVALILGTMLGHLVGKRKGK